MSFLSLIPVIGKFIDKGLQVVDQLVEDKDLSNKIKAAIRQQVLVQDHDEFMKAIDAQMQIILAEARGGLLQRNWRPILMLTIVAIVFNNYLFYPYVSQFWGGAQALALPDHLWSLMKIGVGGYIVGRSGEKVVEKLKGGGP